MPVLVELLCYHCGDSCLSETVVKDDKHFCCNGCKNVYSILAMSNLGNYYTLNAHPGETKKATEKKFEFLDDAEIADKLINFKDNTTTTVTFYVPSIHCSSCIWLLERLNTLHNGIIENRVDFLKKQVDIRFHQHEISLRELAELLFSIGYEPLISLQDVVKQNHQAKDVLLPKIAVAGFCFGNVMLLSFPAYFGLSAAEKSYGDFFSLLIIFFCLPVIFYAGVDYFKQSYINLKKGILTIDFPLALAIAVLFLRTLSAYIFDLGEGFGDSLTGLVFFLLTGKLVQQKTYHHLSFERNYRSFFPVSVQTLDEKGNEKPLALDKIKCGDRILVKNQEIIPADAILLKGDALIDFSFVTGEAEPVTKILGEIIYAGGKQTGSALELEVIKPVSQGYLTGLWNNEVFQKPIKDGFKTFVNKVGFYFSVILLLIATAALLYWLPQNWQQGLNAFTAILIVACPCALALSTPFTMSAALSIFDKNKFYLKNAAVVEQMAAINTLVFDKTGTVTIAEQTDIIFSKTLTNHQKNIIYAVCKNSTHPLSRKICSFLGRMEDLEITGYTEIRGQGILAAHQQGKVLIGSKQFVMDDNLPTGTSPEVHIKIGGVYLGYFCIKQKYRAHLISLFAQLNSRYKTYLLSGDSSQDAETFAPLFRGKENLFFAQSPQNKLDFIADKQKGNAQIMMIGDGLNDSGALKQSNVGIAVTDNINNFTPGSDAILDGESLPLLLQFLRFSKSTVKIIHISFIISLAYNIIGIGYAVGGHLSPLTAAILMPLSTLTIISFTSIATHFAAKKHKLKV